MQLVQLLLYCLLVPILNAPSAAGQVVQSIGTFAGSGYFCQGCSSSQAGDGGPATLARLSYPQGLAVSTNTGDVYVAEGNNYCVRKIKISTRTISTVAGTCGSYGNSGDGGPATSAWFSFVVGLAVSPITGDVYVTDTDNYCVRKIENSTGIISNVAGTCGTLGYSGDGGPATSAQLMSPISVAVLPITGDVYVVDWEAAVIRKIQISTGTISKFAGTVGVPGYSGDGGPATSARLNYPWGIGVSPITGDVYVADTFNNCIRKIENSTGTISKVAGTCGTYGYSGDGGPATSAQLGSPHGVAVSPITGDVYVTERDNNCIRKIENSTGNILKVAGTCGTYGYSGDGGPATAARRPHIHSPVLCDLQLLCAEHPRPLHASGDPAHHCNLPPGFVIS